MVNKIKSGGYIRFCKTSELWLYYKNKQHNLKLKKCSDSGECWMFTYSPYRQGHMAHEGAIA